MNESLGAVLPSEKSKATELLVANVSADHYDIGHLFYTAASHVLPGITIRRIPATEREQHRLDVYATNFTSYRTIGTIREALESEKRGVYQVLEEASLGIMRTVWEGINPDSRQYTRSSVPVADNDLIGAFLLSYERGRWDTKRDEDWHITTPPSLDDIRNYKKRLEGKKVSKMSVQRARELLVEVIRRMNDRLS